MTWILMPVLANPILTVAAIADCLAQTVPTRLLVINQGVDDAFRTQLERIAEEYPDRVLVWSHQPPLPSLSATWNRALDFVWEAGGDEALVVNNDVRLHTETVRILSAVRTSTGALFVSAVGRSEADWFPDVNDQLAAQWLSASIDPAAVGHGGPDFSCYLISHACHRTYRFDEGFAPAFCEDLDYHRRLMLGGDGRRIFSINLPYLHYASATLKSLDTEQADAIRRRIESTSRAHYAAKWGGVVNQERWIIPFAADGQSAFNQGQATTPELQRRVEAGLPPVGCPMHNDQSIECPTCARMAEEYERESAGEA